MALSHYFYNGQSIDTFTDTVGGSYGVIVSRVLHDSAPSVQLATAQIPRADGVAVQERSTAGKRITISGIVKGTDKEDFEDRLDAFKALLSVKSGPLAVTEYGTSGTRTYDATIQGDVQLPREHFHDSWCRFTVEFLCASGVGRSFDGATTQDLSTLENQVDLPLTALDGSGTQAVRITLTSPTTDTPASICVTDHFTDRFPWDIADIADHYITAGVGASFGLGASDGHLSALTITTVAADATAAIKDLSARDGVLTVLMRGTGPFLFARAADPTDPIDTTYVQAYPGALVDASGIIGADTGEIPDPSSEWTWWRLTCIDRSLRLEMRDTAIDTWTTVAEGSTNAQAGAWGVGAYAGLTAIIAHIEFADIGTGQTSTLSVSGDARVIDSGALVTDASRVAGSFPRFLAGENRASVYLDGASRIGTKDKTFYGDMDDASGFQAFQKGAVDLKVGLTFPSETNTYILQRGTFLYLARSFGTAARGDITIRLEATTAGKPNGTVLSDARGNAASVVIPDGTVTGLIGGAAFPYNNSVVPLEIIWGADVPVSASTTYALVLQVSSGGPFFASWYTPTFASSSGDRLAMYTKSDAAAWTSASCYGVAMLAGNKLADLVTPWEVSVAHVPQYL